MINEKDETSLLLSMNGEMLEKLSVEIAEKIKSKQNLLDLNKSNKSFIEESLILYEHILQNKPTEDEKIKIQLSKEEFEKIEFSITELELEIAGLKKEEEKILLMRKQNDEYFDAINAPEAPKPKKHSKEEFENDLKKFGELLDFLIEHTSKNSFKDKTEVNTFEN